MKRYISTILIPCLLLELFGCMGSYVFNDMTIEELKSYNGDEDVMVKTENEEYTLYRKKGARVSTDWKAADSSITLIHKDVKFGPNGDDEIADTVRIYYSEIQKIEIEKWENYTTWEVIGTIAVCLATVGLIALLAAESFHIPF
jgi:hypothetical protein